MMKYRAVLMENKKCLEDDKEKMFVETVSRLLNKHGYNIEERHTSVFGC